jgi:hypothetical protein
MTVGVGYKFIVHFLTLFSMTRSSISRKKECYSFADETTLGFAISFMTSASVALADCCFVFFLRMKHDFTSLGCLQVNLDQENMKLLQSTARSLLPSPLSGLLT